jgi:hypothetical protein
MSAVVALPRPIGEAPSQVRTLAWLEARRFARHPLFLAGMALSVLGTLALGSGGSNELAVGFPVAFGIGVLSTFAAFQLARATAVSDEAMAATPLSGVGRTVARCLACLVPAAAGLLWLAVGIALARHSGPGGWEHGAFSASAVLAILVSQYVLACLGGPLLGVAAARRLTFPGAGLLVVIGLVVWVLVGYMLTVAHPDAASANVVRLLSPMAFFHNAVSDGVVESWRGSPQWYCAYQLLLALAAGLAAALASAPRSRRGRLQVGLVACLVLAATAFALTWTGGLPHSVRTAAVHGSGG